MPAVSLYFVLFFSLVPPQDATLSGHGLEVRYLEGQRTFEIRDLEAGLLLKEGVVRMETRAGMMATDDKSLEYRVEENRSENTLLLVFGKAMTLRFCLLEGGKMTLETEGPSTFEARAASGLPARPVILKHEQAQDRRTLLTALGPAVFSGLRSFFDSHKDLAFSFDAGEETRWTWERGWRLLANLPAERPIFGLTLWRHYYRDTLGIEFYAPMEKRSYWTTAPVVAMTWYGIEGWKGDPAQRKEWLYPQIDWVAEHLLPYDEDLIFQLDDNYLFDDDAYMRTLSDYIRDKGLIPGIWFTPFGVAPEAAANRHPEWFLHDASGALLKAFGGVNFGDEGSQQTAVLNATQAESVEAWYGRFWQKVHRDWNFDFFKIDGQPIVAACYRKSVDGHGVEGYRKGLALARSIVGEDKFINGCWGTPLDAVGLVNGSRTGGDTGNFSHAIDVVIRWNYLNSMCWWCDPDAAANLYKAEVERVRLNAQARVLTGQQFLTDDVWTEVPPLNLRVWQQSFPMLDIHPVNLYAIEDWKGYDLINLRIAKPWGAWDVAGLFSYEGRPVEKVLDLERIPLKASEVHVFDYWNGVYLGRFDSEGKIHRLLKPFEGQLFALVPVSDDRPDLISTSRHLSQGGLDLESLDWQRSGEAWTVRGSSTHVVAHDPYDLLFATNRYVMKGASVSKGRSMKTDEGPLARLRIMTDQAGKVEWTASFTPRRSSAFHVLPGRPTLWSGKPERVAIQSSGPSGFEWKARSQDPRLRLSPDSGTLGSWPAQAVVTVEADLKGLPPGSEWNGMIEVEAPGTKEPLQIVEVRALIPYPENLALAAEASASSMWGAGYEAVKINDGDETTRWNSKQGDVNGAWVLLHWGEDTRFDRAVIDECMDFGHRIQAWRLESEGGEVIAQGGQADRRFVVDLEKPVTARGLKLVVEKASEVPTLWELEVYSWRQSR